MAKEQGKIHLNEWLAGKGADGGVADEPGQYRVYLTDIEKDIGLDDQLNDLWKEAWDYLGKQFPEKYNIKTHRGITSTVWIQGEAQVDYDDPYPKPVLLLFEQLLGAAGLNPKNSIACKRLETLRTKGKYLPLPIDKKTGEPVGQQIHDGKESWFSVKTGKPVTPSFD